jgi:hypothetical protein
MNNFICFLQNDDNILIASHYVGQKPTRACVVLLFKYADYK